MKLIKNKNISSALLVIGFIISMQSLGAVNVQVNPDGTKFTAVLLNGSTSAKYDIVFVGDGFTSSAADQTKFNNAVEDAIDALQHKHPYSTNMCSFNIWRVNVISAESGIDHPLTGISKNTELNCTFGDNVTAPERVIYSTTPAKVTEAANLAPAREAIYVLVNDEEYGGAAGDIVYTSLHTDMKEIIVHELGHFVGHLADEYECYWCDGSIEPPYSGPEPSAVNLTIETNPALIKWKNFIVPGTSIPTTIDNPAGVVGLWEGGGYSPTGIYRPQKNCLMRALNLELCAVCDNSLSSILIPFCTICERFPRICSLRWLRREFLLFRDPIKFRIPWCCFCPLDFNVRKVELELSINPEEFQIEISDGSTEGVKTTVTGAAGEKGKALVSWEEQKNTSYFLIITPRTELKQAMNVSVKLSRNGQYSTLF